MFCLKVNNKLSGVSFFQVSFCQKQLLGYKLQLLEEAQ